MAIPLDRLVVDALVPYRAINSEDDSSCSCSPANKSVDEFGIRINNLARVEWLESIPLV